MPANVRNKFLPPPPFLSSPSFPHSAPPLLLISMFRMWFTCIKGSLWSGPLCIAGPLLVITVKPLGVSLCLCALKPTGGCIPNANNADIITFCRVSELLKLVIAHCWWCLSVKHTYMEWLLGVCSLIPFYLRWRFCRSQGFVWIKDAWMNVRMAFTTLSHDMYNQEKSWKLILWIKSIVFAVKLMLFYIQFHSKLNYAVFFS